MAHMCSCKFERLTSCLHSQIARLLPAIAWPVQLALRSLVTLLSNIANKKESFMAMPTHTAQCVR